MKRKEPEENTDSDAKAKNGRHIAVLVIAAVVCVAVVAGFGWKQFKRRANRPMEIVKAHAIPGTEITIDEGILNFVADKGIKVATDGFRPSWGAEQTAKDEWVVSYVFEVGRQAQWISWRVYPKTGRVVPGDDLAGELWEGRQP